MPRIWKAIYVENDEDAKIVQQALESVALLAPSLEWDQEWDEDKEDED